MFIDALPEGAQTYRKRAIAVRARQATTEEQVTVAWQDLPLTARVGDWVVSDGESQWPVAADIFAATYHANEDGTFTKTATIEAIEIPHAFEVKTLEGVAKGRAGDYLAHGAAGELWPIPRATFLSNYSLL